MKPGIDAGQIEILKRRLLEDADLPRLWDYYLTHFAEHPNFRAMGGPCRSETIENLLRLVGQQLSGMTYVAIRDLMLIQIPSFG